MSIADNVVYNKFQLADMLQWDYKKNPGNRPLEGYVDADWASDAEDRKSVTGFLFKVYGSTVSWASRKQSTPSDRVIIYENNRSCIGLAKGRATLIVLLSVIFVNAYAI